MTQLVCVGKWVDVIDKVNITRKTLTSMCSVYIRRNKTWLLSYQKLFKKKTITLLTVLWPVRGFEYPNTEYPLETIVNASRDF